MVVNCGCMGLASGTWTARTLRVTCMLSVLSYSFWNRVRVWSARHVGGPKLGQRRLVRDRREHDLNRHPDRDLVSGAADDVTGDRHVVVGAVQGDDGHDVG